MLLSLIIPIYKVEKYICGTLSSIYNQSYDEDLFEVICINDGTPDRSMDIVKNFENKHKNIHVINQTNQGLSCARNAGLSIAKGDYIWFVDGDDMLEKKSLQNVISTLENIVADIYAFDIKCFSETTHKENVQHTVLKAKNKFLYGRCWSKEKFVYKTHTAPVQRFVFRHDFIKKYELLFYPNVLHEDVEFMARAFCLAEKVTFLNIAPYRYLIRSSGSIMSSINIRSFRDRIVIIQSLYSFRQSLLKMSDRFFIDVMVMNILFGLVSPKNLNKSDDYHLFLSKNMSMFRRLALTLIPAACYYFSIVKLVKLFLLWASPQLFKCFF